MAWTIWESRNEKVFKETTISVVQAADMVKFRVGWWFKHISKGSNDPITLILLSIAERCKVVKNAKRPKVKVWIPPVSETLMFNVDGSVRGSLGQAGVRGVLQDSTGKVLCVLAENIGIQDCISATIYAISKAYLLCGSRPDVNSKKIIVVSDCKQVVAWINSKGVGDWNYLQQILDIRDMLASLGQVSVEFSPRESNFFADFLAKQGVSGVGNVLMWF